MITTIIIHKHYQQITAKQVKLQSMEVLKLILYYLQVIITWSVHSMLVGTDEGCYCFGLHNVNSGVVCGCYLYGSDDKTYSYRYGLRPVVSPKPNVKVANDGNLSA